MTIEIELLKSKGIERGCVDVSDNLRWSYIKEIAIHIMRQTFSKNVRVGISDRWSNWLF